MAHRFLLANLGVWVDVALVLLLRTGLGATDRNRGGGVQRVDKGGGTDGHRNATGTVSTTWSEMDP